MSYGKLNIWLRNMDCSPRNVWKVELVVKTCGGDYLVDFNPDIIEKMQNAYPDLKISRGSRDGESTIYVLSPDYASVIKHLEVAVPPGCYIVRAWVCYGNLWTDRAMAIVNCGDDACVNLIVPKADNCIRNVLIPAAVEAFDMNLMDDEVRPAVKVLLTTGRMRTETLRVEVSALIRDLRAADVPEAEKYISALQYLDGILKDLG